MSQSCRYDIDRRPFRSRFDQTVADRLTITKMMIVYVYIYIMCVYVLQIYTWYICPPVSAVETCRHVFANGIYFVGLGVVLFCNAHCIGLCPGQVRIEGCSLRQLGKTTWHWMDNMHFDRVLWRLHSPGAGMVFVSIWKTPLKTQSVSSQKGDPCLCEGSTHFSQPTFGGRHPERGISTLKIK